MTTIRPHHTACWSKWRLQRWRQIVDEHTWLLLNAILHSTLHPTGTTTKDGSVMLLRASNWSLSNCHDDGGGKVILNGRSNSSTKYRQHSNAVFTAPVSNIMMILGGSSSKNAHKMPESRKKGHSKTSPLAGSGSSSNSGEVHFLAHPVATWPHLRSSRVSSGGSGGSSRGTSGGSGRGSRLQVIIAMAVSAGHGGVSLTRRSILILIQLYGRPGDPTAEAAACPLGQRQRALNWTSSVAAGSSSTSRSGLIGHIQSHHYGHSGSPRCIWEHLQYCCCWPLLT
ncbi:hypothetical protein ACLKA6_008709 [Drosophila palustris]